MNEYKNSNYDFILESPSGVYVHTSMRKHQQKMVLGTFSPQSTKEAVELVLSGTSIWKAGRQMGLALKQTLYR